MALHHNPRIVTDGLVLALDAGDVNSYPGSGTTWYDLSGNGNNGTLTNGPGFNANGTFSFDGVDDYVRFNSGLYGQTSFSLEVWFNQTAILGSSQEFFTSDYTSQGNQSYPGIEVYSNGSTIYFRSNYNNNTRPATVSFLANKWNHLVCTCEVNSGISIFLNGVEGNSNTPTNPYITWNNEPLNIGALTNYISLLPWNGKVGKAKVYNKSLSLTEILQNYNATKTRFGL